MIQIHNLCKSYGEKKVLDDLTLTVADGSIYGLVGTNGAGKTTLLNLIAGVLRPDSGRITATVGTSEVGTFDCRALKSELYYVTDEPYVLPQGSIFTMADLIGGFYPHFSHELLHKLCVLLGLDEKKRINGFSKGMKRKAALALGFAARPRYLLLDESFDGLDASVRRTVCDLLVEFTAESDSIVILASHDLHEVEKICDTVGIISGTKLKFSGDLDELKEKYRHIRAAFAGGYDRAAVAAAAGGELCEICGTVSFVCEGDPEPVRAALAACGTLSLFESHPMELEEIIAYEIRKEGGTDHVTGIFTE